VFDFFHPVLYCNSNVRLSKEFHGIIHLPIHLFVDIWVVLYLRLLCMVIQEYSCM
jgi:hypothetical protein